MAIIIPHQLSLAPPPVPPPVFSGPLPNPQRSAFLFPAFRFFVSSNLLSRSLRSAILFPLVRYPVSFGPPSCSLRFACLFLLVRYPVPFVPLLRFFRSATPFPLACSFVSFVSFACSFGSVLLFPLFRFSVSFGLLLCFLRSVSCFFWSGSTRHYLVVSFFPSSFSLPFCQVFSPLSNPTHAFLCWRPCPSTFKNTPFLPQDHALQRSRRRPSPPVSVCAWFRVSCKFRFASFPPPSVVTFVCVLVKFFHKPKRLVGNYISHRFSQMNRSLSAHRGNSQTSASRRQISQNLHPSLAETFCVIG